MSIHDFSKHKDKKDMEYTDDANALMRVEQVHVIKAIAMFDIKIHVVETQGLDFLDTEDFRALETNFLAAMDLHEIKDVVQCYDGTLGEVLTGILCNAIDEALAHVPYTRKPK